MTLQGLSASALSSLTTATSNITILRTFSSDIFTGVSISTTAYTVESLQGLKGISNAWPVQRLQLDPVIKTASFSDDAAAGNYSVHEYTGVEGLHRKGVLGKGVVVAVVDTGVEYSHAAVCVFHSFNCFWLREKREEYADE